jgi:proline iminopeptidase
MTKPLEQDPITGHYPEIEPYRTDFLQVSPIHRLYFEESGNPHGIPVIYLHGGPGGGSGPMDRRYFDPRAYRIILMDQRGAGKSQPMASLEENTTWHLVEDLEKLRQHLNIEKWLVFGGSWGSTLSLCYAIQHPERVLGLVLRGIFMLRKQELDWFYEESFGNSAIYPDEWEKYIGHIPENERGNLIQAFYKRLTHPDPQVQLAAARVWSTWEIAVSKIYTPPEQVKAVVTDEFALKFARIECHYFTHKGFFETDGWILKNAHKIRHIPTSIVHGRYDVVCPVTSAWDLCKVLPEAKLRIIPDAGHSAREPGTSRALVQECDLFALKLAELN